jgi:hypothetical protein
MIAIDNRSPSNQPVSWQAGFLELLPAIIRQARLALRQLSPEAKDEALAEVVAQALVAYHRLWTAGQLERAYPTSLARYAILRFHAGRRVGNRLNGHDVSSQHCRRKTGVVLESPHEWQDFLVEDRHAGPAEIAATRIDVGVWLSSLPERTRQLAETLATGETTSRVARMFGLTPGRISQLRRELYQAWRVFQGEVVPVTSAALA